MPPEDDAPPPDDPLGWARDHMPVLSSLVAEDEQSEPFEGYTVAVASHLEATTGVFVETLWTAGATVLFCPSEPRSTHGDVVTSLDDRAGIEAFAAEGMSDSAFREAQDDLLARGPDIVCDDGGDLIARVHEDYPEVVEGIVGATEQTTAGVTRIEAMEREGVLGFPVYAANDTPMKHWIDNVHGTGESALVNVAMTTNATITGKTVVVAGYGYVGRGIASKARGIGAHTVVTEVDPRRAIRAHMDGHRVMSMREATDVGDLFVTATGSRNVVRPEHVERMRDGATLCNAGHFDVEIDLDGLAALAERTTEPRPGVTRYHLPDGRRVNLLAEGRLVNLTGPYSAGHPAEVMDTTFATIYVAARDIVAGEVAVRDVEAGDVEAGDVEAGYAPPQPGVYAVPDRLDRAVAERKLETLGITIDEETGTQREYVDDWHRDERF